MTPVEIEELDILMSLLMTGAATEKRSIGMGTRIGKLNIENKTDIKQWSHYIDHSIKKFVLTVQGTLTDSGRAYLREHYPKRVALLDKEIA